MLRDKFDEMYPGEAKYDLDPKEIVIDGGSYQVVQTYIPEHIGPLSQRATLELRSILSSDSIGKMDMESLIEYLKEYFSVDEYDKGEDIVSDGSVYQTIITFREVKSFYGYDIDLVFGPDRELSYAAAYYDKAATGSQPAGHENGILDTSLTEVLNEEFPYDTEKYDIQKVMKEKYNEPLPTESGSTAAKGSYLCYRLVESLDDRDIFFYLEENRLTKIEAYTMKAK
jgi:hypothetical protein